MSLALNVRSTHFMSSVTSHSTNKRGWPAPMTNTNWSPSREAVGPSVAPANLDSGQRPLETALARGAARGALGTLPKPQQCVFTAFDHGVRQSHWPSEGTLVTFFSTVSFERPGLTTCESQLPVCLQSFACGENNRVTLLLLKPWSR